VVGELAAGARASRAISTSDSARRETDGQARWCGEGNSVHVPVCGLLAGPRGTERPGGQRMGEW
jgi:hypothetical protein